jgi:hypothetical protein
MPLSTLREGLTGGPPLDVIDFDMCLMASADVLELIRGTAHVVVFSQDVEPGDRKSVRGDHPRGAGRSFRLATGGGGPLGRGLYDSYEGNRSQTTKSAFDMAQYEDFSTAWRDVGTSLANTMAANRILLGMASQKSQKFALPQLKDVVNWSDSMACGRPILRSSATRGAQGGGDGAGIPHRDAETGTALIPAHPGCDAPMDSACYCPVGLRSTRCRARVRQAFQAYQQLLPDHPWTRMLAALLVGAPVKGYRDLSPHRYETYLVWDTAAVRRGVDVDLWVLEPDGNLYVPWLGVISPNGTMSGDSHDNDGYFEGYAMNRFVQAGRYKFYAHLYSDTNKVGPASTWSIAPIRCCRSVRSTRRLSQRLEGEPDAERRAGVLHPHRGRRVLGRALPGVLGCGSERSPLSASPSLAVGVESSVKSEGEITSEQVQTVLRNLSTRVKAPGPGRPLERPPRSARFSTETSETRETYETSEGSPAPVQADNPPTRFPT